MQASSHPRRLMRARRAGAVAVVTLVTGVLAAGCGGGSGGSTSPASSAAAARSGSSGTGSRSTAASDGPPGALAFSQCMRSNGVPSFPDPEPGGGLVFHASPALINSPTFKAAQSKCRRLLPGGGPPGPGTQTHPSAQTLAKLLRIAECMRRHGVTQFPDPRTSVPANPSGIREITDFDNAILLFPATINMQAPAYRQALTACGAPPLGLPH